MSFRIAALCMGRLAGQVWHVVWQVGKGMSRKAQRDGTVKGYYCKGKSLLGFPLAVFPKRFPSKSAAVPSWQAAWLVAIGWLRSSLRS